MKPIRVDELVYDLANLDASFRFSRRRQPLGGAAAMCLPEAYGLKRIPGYLESGAPPKYGAGAEQVVAAVHKDPAQQT